MRINIIQEGITDNIGRVFLPGSIQIASQLPVLLHGLDGEIIGFAQGLQRDEENWVSLEFTLRKDFLEQFEGTNDKVTDWYSFSGYGELREFEDAPRNIIKSTMLKAVYAIHTPGFPRSLIMPDKLISEICGTHVTKIHRDGKPPWCDNCGRTSTGEIANAKKATAILPVNPGLIQKGAVTESKDYVKLAREQVAAYINRKAEITDGFKVDVSYLYVVWFSKTLQNWKALISTSLPDGMYYEATFDGEKNKLYIDAYKKFDNESVDL